MLRTVFAASAAALLIASCGAAEPSAPAAPPTPVGQPVAIGNAEYTIRSVETRDAVGGQYFRERAGDGAILVVVTYSLKNTGTTPLGMFDRRAPRLVDPAGVEYSPDLGKSAAYAAEADLDAKVISDLNPGLTMTDADVYEVATASFDPATWTLSLQGASARFALQ